MNVNAPGEVLFGLTDDGEHVWFQCEHMGLPRRLPSGPEGWVVESTDPLTVSPSIDVDPCGCHGWIRDGKWVQA